jgi:hypothetical protein
MDLLFICLMSAEISGLRLDIGGHVVDDVVMVGWGWIKSSTTNDGLLVRAWMCSCL